MNTQDAGTASTTTTSTPDSGVATQTPAMAAYDAVCKEAIRKISTARLALLEAVREAERIKVEDDLTDGLLLILGKYSDGMALATLQEVCDSAKLRIATKKLAGKVREHKPDGQGNTKILILVK